MKSVRFYPNDPESSPIQAKMDGTTQEVMTRIQAAMTGRRGDTFWVDTFDGAVMFREGEVRAIKIEEDS